MSPGLKPDSLVALEVWAEAQTYLRSKGKGNGSEATATAKLTCNCNDKSRFPSGMTERKQQQVLLRRSRRRTYVMIVKRTHY
jgi:hypothetical protein